MAINGKLQSPALQLFSSTTTLPCVTFPKKVKRGVLAVIDKRRFRCDV